MIVIVQPRFSAFVHPAQPLINLSKIIGNKKDILYLISIIAIEHVVGKRAIFKAVECGPEYLIDTSFILTVLEKAGVKFDNNYLEKVIYKYYK